MKLILFLMLISSAFAQTVDTKDINKLHLIQDCKILNMDEQVVKALPGIMCLFFDDGSFISANDVGIKRYGAKRNIMWQLRGHFHHQLALTPDKKRILALASERIKAEGGETVREDTFLIISVETGEVLHRQKSSVLLQMQKQNWLNWLNSPWLVKETGTRREITHFNSFYEIPKNKKSAKGSPFEEGNIIINGLTSGLYILSPDLKKILYHTTLPTSIDNFVHDIQVTKEGNIIYFNNFTMTKENTGKDVDTARNTFSTIQEYDLIKKEVVFEFKSDPVTMFFSRYCGSIQEMDDDLILFSDKFNGAYIYSRKNKKMVRTIRGTHFQNRLPVYNQHTKIQDLSLFLKNSR